MKKFEDFTKEDLWALRGEIVLCSLFVADYRNSFGIDEYSVCEFFGGFISFAEECERDEGFADESPDEFFKRYDNADLLWEWYCCFDDFSWVKYVED